MGDKLNREYFAPGAATFNFNNVTGGADSASGGSGGSGMECMQLRSPPGPFHYLISEQAKSLVALQELQNEVGALLEFRDLVIETFPNLRSKMPPSTPPSDVGALASIHRARARAQGNQIRRARAPRLAPRQAAFWRVAVVASGPESHAIMSIKTRQSIDVSGGRDSVSREAVSRESVSREGVSRAALAEYVARASRLAPLFPRLHTVRTRPLPSELAMEYQFAYESPQNLALELSKSILYENESVDVVSLKSIDSAADSLWNGKPQQYFESMQYGERTADSDGKEYDDDSLAPRS
ncbi:unnamed protein product [Diatraea saccharalis]|uniref:Uncharacterized protein n=1 Tax=Diatraea saccharalis TaxID=40085 RepID=A0A9N9QY97_9NEOP|nr:unnamed protein product [Diatraea saccharalis]